MLTGSAPQTPIPTLSAVNGPGGAGEPHSQSREGSCAGRRSMRGEEGTERGGTPTPAPMPAREANGAERRPTSPTILARRPTCRDRRVRARPAPPTPRSRHQAIAADRRLTVDPRLLPGPSSRSRPHLRPTPAPASPGRVAPRCQRASGVSPSRPSAAARAAAAGGRWKYACALRRSRHPPRTCNCAGVIPPATCWVAQ
jgi:hypothetical protein